MRVSEAILQQVYTSLYRFAGSGKVKAKVSELATHYGVSPMTIYRWAGQKGLRWRKEKSTKGQSKVPDEVVKQVATLQLSSRRRSNKIPLPAGDAVEILRDSGMDTSGLSPARIVARLREKQTSAKDLLRPSPHQILLSDYPNHVWQFDVTNCIQYFLDDKGIGERSEEMELYKNKIVKTAKNIRRELLRYAAVDHCTGAFFFWYYYASGERAIDGADFLFRAMRPKDELIEKAFNGNAESKKGKYHFHGVPFMLVPDRGSIVVDKANQSLFNALCIDVRPHMPGNPRAKGSIEGLMRIINSFEARLKYQNPGSVDQLNAWALDWGIGYNGLKYMRGVAPRSAMWSTIRPAQLRLCPDEKIFKMLLRRPEVEKPCNGACLFHLEGMTYKLPDSNAANRRVKVVINPYEYPAVEAHFNGYVWLCRPIPKDQYGRLTDGTHYGEYKTPKHTQTQTAKAEMEKIAEGWGLKWKGTGDKRIAMAPPVGHESPLQVFGHQADKINVEFINRKGSELEIRQPDIPENISLGKPDAITVSRGIAARRIPFAEFLKRLIAGTGPVSTELNQQLRAEYGDSIEISKAEEVIRELEDRGKGFEDSRGRGEKIAVAL